MTEIPNRIQTALSNVTAEGDISFRDITQNINVIPSQINGSPFEVPTVREGGLFGRDEDLNKLHELLQSGKNVCVVSGMGSVGKTELVRSYATSKVCLTEFNGGIFYIDNGDRQNLAAQIVAWTKWKFKQDLEPTLSDAQKVMACWYTWKAQTEKVLLILDSVAQLADNAQYFIPPKDVVSVRVVLTSREQPDQKIVEKLELEILSPETAKEFLGSLIGAVRIERELSEASLLCEDLGQLPLAIELVGAYLSTEDYKNLSLQAMRKKLANKLQHPSLSPKTMPMGMTARLNIIAAFDLSWDKLEPQAQCLGCLLSVFGSTIIHWHFIVAMYQYLLGETWQEDDLRDRWLKNLRRMHLVLDVDKDIYDLHPLVKEYFALQLQQRSDQNLIKQVFCEVIFTATEDVDSSTSLSIFNLLEPHLKKAVRILDHDQDNRLAYALNQLAILYQSQGTYSKAEPLFLESLLIYRQQLETDHLTIASSLNNLAKLYESQGRYIKAEPLFLESLSIYQHQLVADHPSIAMGLNNLAVIYQSQERYSKAELLLLQSLKIKQQQSVPDYLDIATGLNNLAELYRTQGRYSEAEPLYLESLLIIKQQLRSDHPITASSLNNLALLYSSQGRYGEAESLFLDSLSIYKQQLGANHPDTARSFSNLARLYKEQGRYSEAEPLYLQSLEIREQRLGAYHPYTVTSINNLAVLYQTQGRNSEAESLYLRSLTMTEKLGVDHCDNAYSRINLAFIYEAEGKYAEAQALAQRALAIFQSTSGEQHPNTQSALFTVKVFQTMILLNCDRQTLFNILKALAQQAEIPDLTTEVKLNLLEAICTNIELLCCLQDLLLQPTEALSINS